MNLLANVHDKMIDEQLTNKQVLADFATQLD